MEELNRNYQTYCKLFAAVYAVMGVALGVYNLFFSTPYYVMLSFASLAFLAVPAIVERVLRLRTNYLLHFTIYLYSFMAFMIGMVFNGYSRIPFYDKLAHTITGVVFGLAALILFYLLKEGHQVERRDLPLAGWFSVSFSALVAVVWEIWEYAINFFLHNDPQKVLATGVNDTMQDMIVCLIGALALLPSLLRYYRQGKAGFLMKVFESFRQLSLAGRLGGSPSAQPGNPPSDIQGKIPLDTPGNPPEEHR